MRRLSFAPRRALHVCLSIGFAVIVIAMSAGISRGQTGAAAKNPIASSKDSIATGAKLYQKSCQFCHGPKGLGDGPAAPKGSHPSNLVDAKWDHGSKDVEIFQVIQNGIGPDFLMAGVKGRLSDTDIWHIINYVRSIGPKGAPTN